MKARAVFAAIVALFQKPEWVEPYTQHAHVLEEEGLVSHAAAFSIRAAFARFAQALRGGG